MNGFSEEWDEIYNKNLQLTSWPWSDLVSLVYRHCSSAISRNGLVFELGCGAGPNIPFIQSLGMNYYGVEGSETVVNNLHQKFPELKENVTVGDFTQEDCFSRLSEVDVIVDRASVTHNNLSDIKNILKGSNDVLKNGGYFIGIDWFSTKHSDFSLGEQEGDMYTRTNIETGQFKNVGSVHFSDENHLRSIFSGFKIVSLEEKVIKSYEPQKNHQFSSWNIVAQKK